MRRDGWRSRTREAKKACGRLEVRLAHGEDIDATQHATLSNTMLRLAIRLGLDRVPRNVETPLSFVELSGHAATASVDAPAGTSTDDEGDD
jgi:hypothetical protein